MDQNVPAAQTPPVSSVPPTEPIQTQKNYLIPIAGTLIFFVVAGALYYFLQNKSANQTKLSENTTSNSGLAGSDFESNIDSASVAKITQAVPTPTLAIDPTANWKTHTNTNFNYLVKYPSDATLFEDNKYYHYVEFKNAGAAQGEFPIFYLAAIKDTYIAKDPASVNYLSSDVISDFYALKIGEDKTQDMIKFTRDVDRNIGGENALTLKVTATGVNQDRYYVKHGGNIYMFVSDRPSENFQKFLNSVTFTK